MKRKRVRTLSIEQRKLLEFLLDEPGSTLSELVAGGIYHKAQNVERALSGLIARGLITFTTVQCEGETQTSYTPTYLAKKIVSAEILV